MNYHEFINYELEFYLNNPYILIQEEILSMLDERDDAANNVHIGDVVVDRVGFKDVESALVTLKEKTITKI